MAHVMERIHPAWALVWIVCLAFLSVGARNFESGISLDGPIYATIARNIVDSGEWFRLNADLPDYQPYFADHPHLGFWMLAPIFHWLGAHDWSSRILGHLFYVGFLWIFFLWVRTQSNPRVAVWTVILLWSWYQFSNVFSNVYLDPGCLFFGFLSIACVTHSLSRKRPYFAAIGGCFLAASFLYKGATALGFVPAIGVALLISKISVRQKIQQLALGALGLVSILSIYVIAVLSSNAPDFFDLYWSRQMTNRFNQIRDWKYLFAAEYWKSLLRYSYYLALLALLALPKVRKQRSLVIPITLFVTFVLMFAPVKLNGGQYLLMILPWLAWLIAETLAKVPLKANHLINTTLCLAIAAVFVIQYLPIRTHARRVSHELHVLKHVNRSGKKSLWLELGGYPDPSYLKSGSYAWYGGVSVKAYNENQSLPKASQERLYLISNHREQNRLEALSSGGWCRYERFEHNSLWRACSDT